VPFWAWLLIAIVLAMLVRTLWIEIALRARQIRILRDEREREIRDFAEWNARWNERHAGSGDQGGEPR
jgi:hypothetical protein